MCSTTWCGATTSSTLRAASSTAPSHSTGQRASGTRSCSSTHPTCAPYPTFTTSTCSAGASTWRRDKRLIFDTSNSLHTWAAAQQIRLSSQQQSRRCYMSSPPLTPRSHAPFRWPMDISSSVYLPYPVRLTGGAREVRSMRSAHCALWQLLLCTPPLSCGRRVVCCCYEWLCWSGALCWRCRGCRRSSVASRP